MKKISQGLIFLNPYNPDPPSNYFGPPYGISLIAACIAASGVKIPISVYDFDLETRRDMLKSVEKIIIEDNPLYVAIAAQSCTRGGVYELIELVRKINPNITIILGGPFATVKYDFLLENFKIDYIVVGDGEKTMVNLVRCLKQHANPGKIKGIAFLKNGKVCFTGEGQKVSNLDSLPYPAFHLFKGFNEKINSTQTAFEESNFILGHRCTTLKNALLLLSSRGCIYSCNFCPMSKVGKQKIRFHTPEYFVNMVGYFHQKYRIKDFVFGDNFFTLSRDRVMKICELIQKKNLKIRWSCMTRSDRVDKELLAAMAAAGCFEISYGVESGSAKVQKKIGKNLDLEKTKLAFQDTKKAGIRSVLMLMVGNTGEDKTTISETLSCVKNFDADRVLVKKVKVYPGTAIHDLFENKGLLKKGYYKTAEYAPPSFTYQHSEEELEKLGRMIRERQVYVQVNSVCNNNCFGCKLFHLAAKEQLKRAKNNLILAASRSDNITFYGGEIFLRKDIFSLLNLADKLSIHHLSVLSNCRIFSYSKMVEKIQKYYSLQEFIVPFFGLEQVHDRAVMVKGAFRQAIQGVRNLREASRFFGVKAVIYITEPNRQSLERLVKVLIDLGVYGFKFVFSQDSLGLVEIPPGELPPMDSAFQQVERIGKSLQRQNIEFLFEGFPACVSGNNFLELSETGFPFDEAAAYNWGLRTCSQIRAKTKIKLNFCSKCKNNTLCEGVWTTYLQKYGKDEFYPFR